MTRFYSSINVYFVKLLILIAFISNFVGIRQTPTPLIELETLTKPVASFSHVQVLTLRNVPVGECRFAHSPL